MPKLKERDIELGIGIKEERPATVLSARGIYHSYDGHSDVLRDINVELKQGLFTMVLGRSGCGKTTLIKILAGLIKPTQGKIDLLVPAGQTGSNVRFPHSHTIAYIPQNLGLVRNMTALDNVLMGALGYTGTLMSVINRFGSDVYAKAEEILADLGLESKSKKKIWHLSGGERQRVAIARALIQNPKLILADEFVSQLDPVTSLEILSIMKTLAQNKIALLITTHDMGLVEKYADWIIIMKDGKVYREHSASDFIAKEIFEEIK